MAKTGIPKIHPREPLTEKARQAITTYMLDKCGELRIYPWLVRYVLEAERMPRARLYAWLEGHGYKWNTRVWRKLAEKADGHADQR